MEKLAMPNSGASQRTRNRFREHSLAPIERTMDVVDCLEGKAGALMRCTDQFCDWVGWFPQEDLTVVEDEHL